MKILLILSITIWLIGCGQNSEDITGILGGGKNGYGMTNGNIENGIGAGNFGNIDELILGAWYHTENGETGVLTFSNDGTFVMQSGGYYWYGTYSINGNQLTLSPSDGDTIHLTIVSISSTTMKLRDEDGGVTTWTKS